MKAIFLLQLHRFRRAPFLVLSFFALTFVFLFVIVGMVSENKLTIYTYKDDILSEDEAAVLLDKLNESEGMYFQLVTEEEAREFVEAGDATLALQLTSDNYKLLINVDNETKTLVETHVNEVMIRELRLQQLEKLAESEDFREQVEKSLSRPVLSLKTTVYDGNVHSYTDEERLLGLFGTTLYFSIFTMMFSLMNVAEEKRGGTWDRIIVSPIRKWEMYVGHLLYCFLVGYAQIIAVIFLSKYLFKLDLGSNIGTMFIVIGCYIFAIVALGMLLIGIVKTSQQLQAVIPVVATGMAMIGGAFWPLDIVSNKILLALAKVMPTYYGAYTLIDVALFDYTLFDILKPIAIMLLFGVICMAIGINVMERRA